MSSYIHLIRHGITEANKRRLYYGTTDLSLSKEGVENIIDLTKKKIYPSAEEASCYASKLIRTQETFALIYGKRKFEILNGFHEMQFGEFEMKSPLELEGNTEYQRWITDDTKTVRPPGGESIEEFRVRIRTAFKQLIVLHGMKESAVHHKGKDAVSIVICHGGVIGSVMSDVFPGKHENMWRWTPDPGRGYTLNLNDGKVHDFAKI